MTELTQDLLKELFDYHDGKLYWAISRGSAKIGDCAGTIDNMDYRSIMINYKVYKVHRLIFLYYHGFLPEFLDHIDGDPKNNNINNLREATKSQNSMNRIKKKFHKGKLTTSIYKGVYLNKSTKKWYAQITIDRNYWEAYLSSLIFSRELNDELLDMVLYNV